MSRFSTQRLNQRIEKIENAFRKLGVVRVTRDPRAAPQLIEISVSYPGWGDTQAEMLFTETWALERESWSLVKYDYDLFMKPGPDRLGFHWHDGLYHTHCASRTDPGRDHHYAGAQIDIFKAFERFASILSRGRPISCVGLRPLRS